MPLPRTIRRHPFRHLQWYHWLTVGLSIAFILSLAAVLRIFYVAHSMVVPTVGGTYIEGSVGELLPLNPWFIVTNDVNRDIVSLIFSGLLKYDPKTKHIEEDLASMEVSGDGKIYTLTLREELQWHDSTQENPHPVTADDVLFTFQTVQDPQFPNSMLRQNFRGVTIERLDDRTVRFILAEPYSFFPSNLTLGLLPARAFEGVPPGKMDMALDFGFHPVGAGPYAFKGMVQTELSTEITLERFPRPMEPMYHLERVVFRIFPDYVTLLSDLRNLHGVRLVPRNDKGEPLVPRSFHPVTYTLPQYVALFLNTEDRYLQDKTLRLALQLGTNKQAIADIVNESLIVDTPLLEIDMSDWRYQYDPTAAQGALFNSQWHLPEKVRLQRLLEIRETNLVGDLQMESIVFLSTGATLTVTGSITSVGSTGGLLNGVPLQLHPTNSGAWITQLPTQGTGALRMGLNQVQLSNDRGSVVDSAYVWRTDSWSAFRRASREQDLLERFVSSRDSSLPEEECIDILDLTEENGMLCLRGKDTLPNIRVNARGEPLRLRLLTSPSPPQYAQIAKLVREQWRQLGIGTALEIPETRAAFEEKLLRRDYDVLLFGQSLLDNLDSYPY
ncbi:ABC transporter substrate-binding protein, partial [Candidatus Peribacteria bacterium]|nr:ABC transporter substrate-binding protein [Candidatus Peribacteria bacterium]